MGFNIDRCESRIFKHTLQKCCCNLCCRWTHISLARQALHITPDLVDQSTPIITRNMTTELKFVETCVSKMYTNLSRHL